MAAEHRLTDPESALAPAGREPDPLEVPEPTEFGFRGVRRAAHAGVRPCKSCRVFWRTVLDNHALTIMSADRGSTHVQMRRRR